MPTRRTVLQAAIAGGTVAVFSGTLGGLRAAIAAGTVPERRSLGKMALDDPDLSAYRDFVGIMQGYDQNKPLSWLGYSLQHGAYNGGFKYCPHGDWYFLPWHRAYVVMYENAVRALTSHKQFAMPYWDWTADWAAPSKAAVWDPQSGVITVLPNLPWDVFCNGMAFFPDGRALIIGGTESYDPFTGDARATIFDPATQSFAQVESMTHGRWYATATRSVSIVS